MWRVLVSNYFKVKFKTYHAYICKVSGCRAGGSFMCKNGYCKENGECKCDFGYKGPTCSECN